MEKAEKQTFEVIVVGAGIAGSLAARLLAQKGISVLLLEKDDYAGKTKACGGLFDRSYFDRFVDDERIIEQRIRKNIFHLPWGDVTYDCDQVTVKRRIFDRHLAQEAKKAGAMLMNRQKVISFEVKKPGEVEATVKETGSDRLWQARASIILLADGPHSVAFQNPFFKRQLKKKYWAYAQVYEVKGVALPRNEAHIYFSPRLYRWGYGWIFPYKKESNVGVGAILSELAKRPLKQKLFEFLRIFPQTAPLLKGRPIVDKKGGYIPMWLLNRLSDDSQLVLGDAGGMVSPLFGAGINYAMEAAEACVPVVQNALKSGDFSARALKAYDLEIKKRFGRELRKQMALAKIIIFSKHFGKLLPVKILSIIAFGVKYSRWNKIKILAYPWLGRPMVGAPNRGKASD
ncbi:NAD(P)/FAD-dependent oxidoreductase [Caldithrix abyssi]